MNKRTGELVHARGEQRVVYAWPTRVPNDRSRWVYALATGDPAFVCPVHSQRTDDAGVCASCQSEILAAMESPCRSGGDIMTDRELDVEQADDPRAQDRRAVEAELEHAATPAHARRRRGMSPVQAVVFAGWNLTTERAPGLGLCWESRADRDRDGYARVRVGGRWYSAHRVMLTARLEAEGLTLDPDALACHRCNNRRCVRGDHLRPGTAADNAADRDGRGPDSPKPTLF